MFALVQWSRGKAVSIVPELDLLDAKGIGEKTRVRYGKKTFLATVKMIHDNEDHLAKFAVTKNGEVMTPKSYAKKIQLQCNEDTMKVNKRLQNCNKLKVRQALEERIASWNTKSEQNNSMGKATAQPEKPSHQPSPSWDATSQSAIDPDQEHRTCVRNMSPENMVSPQITPQNHRRPGMLLKSRIPVRLLTRVPVERQNWSPGNTRRYITSPSPSLRSRHSLDSHRDIDFPSHDNRHQIEELTVDDPDDTINVSQRQGEGRVRIHPDYHVYMDQGELEYIQRWYRNPKEMARRMMKLLVGKENLMNATAKGRRAKNFAFRPAIPIPIYETVEKYVASKCVYRLTPSEFSTCINQMINNLRHPRR